MSEMWARTALQTYRWLGAAIYPFMGTYVALRMTRGKEERGRRHERYGYSKLERPDGPLIWVHAASVGETGAVSSLIQKIRALGNDMALDPGMGNCGKQGQWVPVGVGQPTVMIGGLTVGGSAT